MKISNSKKQLAKIISENGGWRDEAESAAQCSNGEVSFWHDTAKKQPGEDWCGSYLGARADIEFTGVKLTNWHQTILSQEEYFHLYPAPDAVVDEPEHIWTNPPTIEQLAADYRSAKDYADRKQQEADTAKSDSEAKLAELVAAGKVLGLVLSVAAPEPELVITDWRDLKAGDVVKAVVPNGGKVTSGEIGIITEISEDGFWSNFPSQDIYYYYGRHFDSGDVIFIRRP